MLRRFLALTFFSVACTAPPAEQVVTLPSEPSDTLRLPTLFATGDYAFGEVAFVELLDDGGIAVADYLNSNIALFSENGEFARTIGRTGDGPGETSRPSLVTQFPSGELAVITHDATRITLLGDDPEIFPLRIEELPRYFTGRLAPGPVVYGRHHQRTEEGLDLRLVEARPSADVVEHKPFVRVEDFGGRMYEWVDEDGRQQIKGQPYAQRKPFAVNRHGQYAFTEGDSAIVLGSFEDGVTQRFPAPDWSEIEQKEAVLDDFYGDGRPPGFELLPPIRFTSIYLDDSGRLWVGRSSYSDRALGEEYTAFVIDPSTLESVAVLLPARSYMFLENFFVRGDRAAAVVTDSLGVEEVHVLNLSGLPVVGPDSNGDAW